MNVMPQVYRATGKGTLETKGSNGQGRYHHWNSGKSFRWAMGGYTTAKKEIIELLRQRSDLICFRIHWHQQ
jgi:7-keto-8-aminopelargonate synthetase-like enzyme